MHGVSGSAFLLALVLAHGEGECVSVEVAETEPLSRRHRRMCMNTDRAANESLWGAFVRPYGHKKECI